MVSRLNIVLFNIFLFLTFFEIPIYKSGTHFLGLYDVYVALYFVFLFTTLTKSRNRYPRFWLDFSVMYFCYLGLLFFELILLDSTKSVLIIVKQMEYLLAGWILVINIHAVGISPKRVGRYLIVDVFLLACFQLVSWLSYYTHFHFIKPGLGYGSWFRIGLPFMSGTSSNPAGFVLLVVLVYFISSRNPGVRSSRLRLYSIGLAALALLLTVSRTNIIAFLLFLVLGALRQYLLRRNLAARIAVTTGLIILAIGLLILPLVIPKDSHLYLFVKLISNPGSALHDKSFKLRYDFLWVQELHDWFQSFQSLLIGRGLNYYPISDSTYIGLLVNQGILGLLMFFAIWIAFPLLYSRSFLAAALVVSVFVNGINADTLTLSYRAVQVFILIFVLSFYERSFSKGN